MTFEYWAVISDNNERAIPTLYSSKEDAVKDANETNSWDIDSLRCSVKRIRIEVIEE